MENDLILHLTPEQIDKRMEKKINEFADRAHAWKGRILIPGETVESARLKDAKFPIQSLKPDLKKVVYGVDCPDRLKADAEYYGLEIFKREWIKNPGLG